MNAITEQLDDDVTLEEIMASIRRLLAEDADHKLADKVLRLRAPRVATLSSGAVVVNLWGTA